MSTVKTPPQVTAEPLRRIQELLQRNQLLERQNEWLKQRIGLLKSKEYGSSSEATCRHPELSFNEAEALSAPETHEPTVETITYRRVKAKGKRAADLSNLPVEEIRYELPEAERICPQCSGHLHEMGEDVSQEIKIVPATAIVIKRCQVKYGCRHCANHGTGAAVITAVKPAQAFPNSLASASAAAYIIDQKYELGVPLYRQERYLQGLGLNLSRQTMANWVLRGAQVLEPLSQRMKDLLLQRDILHADETTVQVLHETGRAATTKSYMWLYRSGRGDPPLVLYDYQTTHGAIHPQRYLKKFEGYLHVDGYASYDNLPGITLVGCWAHARRKFDEVLRSLPPGPGSPEGTVAYKCLEFCNRFFKIERELRDCTPEQRHAGRQERSVPLLHEFEAWLAAQALRTLPASALGKAINYCRNQWPKLQNFLLDGRLELDNNRAERSIKPFVIGRKNWLFSNTPKGATASALLYSIIETAKENGLVPAKYLEYLFERLPGINTGDATQLDALLPWTPEVQATCKKNGSG